MSCGSKRGLIDMDISLDYLAAKDIVLLQGDVLSNDMLSSVGIATEHGEYSFLRDQYIKDYFKKNSSYRANPLALETNASSLVLNETQLSIGIDSLIDDYRNAIQLTPLSWLSAKHADEAEVSAFNEKHKLMRVIYEFELQSNPNADACLDVSSSMDQMIRCLPLNDILDLCIKSRFKKSLANSNIPFNMDQPLSANASYDQNVDQYLVVDEYPIEFCQCNNDAYALTQPMTMQPYRLKSTLQDHLEHDDGQLEHTFELQQEQIATYLYKSPSEYGVSSYEQYLSGDNNLTMAEALISVFMPSRSINGVKYNYIINIEQSGSSSRTLDNSTIYANGDIYGHFQLAKNMYNPLYSIEMHDKHHIENCRTYCGIQNSSNMVLLKYYDNVEYSFLGDSDDTIASATYKKRLPYQKVEFYNPQRMSSSSKHKSNLFSIKIFDSALDDAFIANKEDDTYEQIATNIKKDISNGVRALAESIAPANTQLFDTYFQQ